MAPPGGSEPRDPPDAGGRGDGTAERKSSNGDGVAAAGATEPAVLKNAVSTAPSDAAAALAPGTLIEGKYRVVDQLGFGAMGVVYLARDEKLNRLVAIKFVHAHLVGVASDRLLVEARAMARVRHDNVVAIYSFGDLEGLPYFVMEFVPGVDLDTWLHQHAPLSVDEAIGIITQICLGVQAIHDADAVHHDLKPGNVFVGPGFRIVVGDLGLASLVPGTARTDAPGGTPFYMAPELIDGKPLGAAAARSADIYALGVIAFELLTGAVPFEGTDTWQVLRRQRDEQPRSPSDVRPELPAQFDEPVLAALAKDPTNRPPSARAFAESLHRARPVTLPPPSRIRILVADDDEDFRELAKAVLEEALPGVVVECAVDGVAALAALERQPATVAVVDLQMPKMNGLELVAALREHERLRSVRTVIATAVGGATDWRVLAKLGSEAFLPKPIEPSQLVDTVARLLGRVA